MPDEVVSHQLVVFTLRDEEYALPIGQVHEIIRYTEPRTIASSDPCVHGIISLRGRIVPVFDLSTRLGLERSEATADSKIVIVESGDDMAGVIVDDVEEVLTIESSQIDEAPTSAGSGCIDGVAKIDDRLVVLLDPDSLIGIEGGSSDEYEGVTPELRVVA